MVYFCKKNSLGRIMALDYGKVRTGIAVTDELQIIASGLTTVNTKELLNFLRADVQQENGVKFVVVDTTQMYNMPSESEELIKHFLRSLEGVFPKIPVERQDERFTSKMAMQTMIDSGIEKQKRNNKALIDEISATIILQAY